MGYLLATTTVLYYLLYPLLAILLLLFSLLRVLTSPFLFLGRYVLLACWYPFHVLGKFETLYYFFGVAAVVGVLTGMGLHYLLHFVGSLLNLEGREEPRGRTVAAYRTEKREKLKQKENGMLLPTSRYTPYASGDVTPKEDFGGLLGLGRGRRSGSLIGTTILEEDDSSEGGF